jgi:hypothetical protein
VSSKNERGAGRKPLPYKTIQKRIPEPVITEVDRIIEEFKKKAKESS